MKPISNRAFVGRVDLMFLLEGNAVFRNVVPVQPYRSWDTIEIEYTSATMFGGRLVMDFALGIFAGAYQVLTTVVTLLDSEYVGGMKIFKG